MIKLVYSVVKVWFAHMKCDLRQDLLVVRWMVHWVWFHPTVWFLSILGPRIRQYIIIGGKSNRRRLLDEVKPPGKKKKRKKKKESHSCRHYYNNMETNWAAIDYSPKRVTAMNLLMYLACSLPSLSNPKLPLLQDGTPVLITTTTQLCSRLWNENLFSIIPVAPPLCGR